MDSRHLPDNVPEKEASAAVELRGNSSAMFGKPELEADLSLSEDSESDDAHEDYEIDSSDAAQEQLAGSSAQRQTPSSLKHSAKSATLSREELAELRKARRRFNNRESARRVRARRIEEFSALQAKVEAASNLKEELASACSKLQRDKQRLESNRFMMDMEHQILLSTNHCLRERVAALRGDAALACATVNPQSSNIYQEAQRMALALLENDDPKREVPPAAARASASSISRPDDTPSSSNAATRLPSNDSCVLPARPSLTTSHNLSSSSVEAGAAACAQQDAVWAQREQQQQQGVVWAQREQQQQGVVWAQREQQQQRSQRSSYGEEGVLYMPAQQGHTMALERIYTNLQPPTEDVLLRHSSTAELAHKGVMQHHSRTNELPHNGVLRHHSSADELAHNGVLRHHSSADELAHKGAIRQHLAAAAASAAAVDPFSRDATLGALGSVQRTGLLPSDLMDLPPSQLLQRRSLHEELNLMEMQSARGGYPSAPSPFGQATAARAHRMGYTDTYGHMGGHMLPGMQYPGTGERLVRAPVQHALLLPQHYSLPGDRTAGLQHLHSSGMLPEALGFTLYGEADEQLGGNRFARIRSHAGPSHLPLYRDGALHHQGDMQALQEDMLALHDGQDGMLGGAIPRPSPAQQLHKLQSQPTPGGLLYAAGYVPGGLEV